LLDSFAVKAQPKNNHDANTKRSCFQLGGSPCRRLKKAIRKIRNRRQTKTRLRMCRPTRRRKARASQPAARSRKSLDAKFGRKRGRYDNSLAGIGSLQCRERHEDSPRNAPSYFANKLSNASTLIPEQPKTRSPTPGSVWIDDWEIVLPRPGADIIICSRDKLAKSAA
jgi:hypothetical protein